MIKIVLSRVLGEKRLTQTYLARKTGIRKATIWEYYNEYTETIKLSHIDKICDALDCEITDILERKPNDPDNS